MTAQIITFPDRRTDVPELPEEPENLDHEPRPSLGQRIEEAALVSLAIAGTCAFWGVHLYDLFQWLFPNS